MHIVFFDQYGLRRLAGLWRGVAAALAAAALLAGSVAPAAGSEFPSALEGTVGATVATQAAAAGWWDGTGALAQAPPAIAEQGQCAALGDGRFVLLGSGSLSKVCYGVDGSFAGSPVGVGWAAGFDAEGPFVEVLLVGAATMDHQRYRGFGELDVVFGGGAFAADFAGCEYQSASGWSSCRTVAAGATLPPGGFVGVGTVGIDLPARRARSSDDGTATPAVQRAALVALYNSTDGANWTRNTNWNTTDPVADWYGVTTDGDGNVTWLYLSRNSLSGSIPTQIGDLASLTSLNLDRNSLSGSIPAEIGDLASLTSLNLDRNSLSGSIPAEIGDLASLTSLDLASNGLSGSIPSSLGNLTSLYTLRLNSNSLSGGIPDGLRNLSNLERLSLGVNGLSGSVPSWLGSLTKLTHLHLNGTDLSGGIPQEIGDLANLVHLGLRDNDLSGEIPEELGSLSNLVNLQLDTNRLSGSIPEELSNLSNLQWLKLDRNSLSGSIPARFGDLTSLQRLHLGGNRLSGQIPAGLAGLTDLRDLFLDNNSLSGSIPAELGRLSGLRQLWLHRNSLTGAIPEQLGDLTLLHDLYLRDNNLSGTIPSTLGNLAELLNLSLSGNNLSGAIPAEIGNLIGLRRLDLSRNSLSGSIPAGLGGLTNLNYLNLSGNSLSGCVPAALVSVSHVAFDSGLTYCFSARMPVGFRVAEDHGSRSARGGVVVSRSVVLEYAGGAGSPFGYRDVAVEVQSGPSAGASVRCRVRSLAALSGLDDALGSCRTDIGGGVTLVYTAGSFGRDDMSREDELRVFVDSNRDGIWQDGEPFADLAAVRFSHAARLVALGDSYSAGENGQFRASGGFGAGSDGGYYLTDNPAAFDCHRWNRAYARLLPSLESSVYGDVETYACTGAITLNVFHPDDRDYDGLHDTLGAPPRPSVRPRPGVRETIETNRPSPAAEPYVWPPPTGGQDEDWEPRQGRSLRDANTRQAVDMVTLTIGGNDLGFADVIKSCYLGGCAPYLQSQELTDELSAFGETLAEVFAEIKAAARDAAVFVLGYPYLVPYSLLDYQEYLSAVAEDERHEVPNPGTKFLLRERERCDSLRIDPLLKAVDVPLIDEDSAVSLIDALASLPDLASEIDGLYGPGLFGGGDSSGAVMDAANLLLKIDTVEKVLLATAADRLNGVIESRAREAGVHVVDVSGAFRGHDQCGSDPWLNGLVVDEQSSEWLPLSGRSFHPNAAGHEQYAAALLDFVASALEEPDLEEPDVVVNAAGLPANPAPELPSSSQQAKASQGASGSSDPGGSGVRSGGAEPPEEPPEESSGVGLVQNTVLWPRRVSPAGARCGNFLAPGDGVVLSAEGFAPASSVTFVAVAATVSGAVLPAVSVPAVTADAAGSIEAAWTVPAVVAGEDSAAPRAYLFKAVGADASSDALAAFTPGPLVAYPSSAPCAVDDSAATTIGRPVRVAVLANDTAAAGGSLDPASVTVAGVHGGEFAVDSSDGSLTFTPAVGFVGTVTARYRVADNWAMPVGASVTVTVDAGCTITGTTGVTDIAGTDGADVICVPDPKDRSAFHMIDAKAGDDIIIGGDGVEWVHAGAGTDTVYGRGGDDEITGGVGTDTVYGGAGFDTVFSVDLADSIVDDADGYELLVAEPSSSAHTAPVVSDDAAHTAPGETLEVSVLDNDYDPNENLAEGSLAIVTAPVAGTAQVAVSATGELVIRYVAGDRDGADSFSYEVCDTLGACGTAEVAVTVGTSGCTIVGTPGDDTLVGTSGADVICGLGGDDTLYGLDGDDILIGGPGDDTLYGGDHTRIGATDGDDILFGGSGDDTLAGGNGDDTLWGGAGSDSLEGNRRSDVLVGGTGSDILNGGGENDTLWGGIGDDTLIGHAGDDALHGGPGDDTLTGGNGDDTLRGGPGADTLTGGAGDDALWGGSGDDTLDGNSHNDTLWGGPGADSLRGGGHNDRLIGGPGGDTLRGDAGDDRLWGQGDGDTLDGGNGSDYIDGGDGTDACTRGETTARCEP